ncbi:MAG: FAD-dependent oxidoreductase [Anaerolineaceae bacterium]|nr:FAD-dependent oxidoreductase [Anaerolineaceae bacterium]
MEKKRVGIIGGGIVGTAVGYYLSLYKDMDVTVFEKNTIGSGTTAKSAGTVCLFDDSLTRELWDCRLYGFQTYVKMDQEERGSSGFDKTGTLVVATDEKVEKFIKDGIALSQAEGYQAEYITDPKEILKHCPDLSVDGVLGAGWTPDDGYFDPTMAATTFSKKMKANGGKTLIQTKVEKINTKGDRVTGVETNKGSFDLDVIVDASGPWTRYNSRLVGLELPIWHTKAEVFFLVPPKKKLSYTFPVLKYPRFYARREGDNVFICKAHLTMDLNDPMHAGIWNPDLLTPTGGTDEYFQDFLFDQLEQHVPGMLDSGVAFSWLGYRAEPPDFLPILGDTPVENYMLAIGCGGNGVIEAPAIGRDLAMYIASGEKSLLLQRLPLDRFSKKFDLRAVPAN